MKIVDQNWQSVTKDNRSYDAEQFALFWTTRSFFSQKVIWG